jgi:hypothetical protein
MDVATQTLRRARATRAFGITLWFIAAMLPALFLAEAQAVIAFRAASSAGVRAAAISYVATGNVRSASNGNVSPQISNESLNDLLLCLVEQHDNVAISFPAGWTQLYSISVSATHRASAYYKRSAATEVDPLITHPGGNSIIARCSTFRGVDAENPFDVAYAAQYAANSASVTSGSLTTLSADDWVLFALHIANNPTISAAPGGAGGVTWTYRYYSSTTQGLDTAIGLYTGPLATPGAVGPISATISATEESHGVLMALRNGSRLSIEVPAGTVAGDVMIAAITTSPENVPITAPAGWTLIEDVVQTAGTGVRVATYYRVATAGEPASYTWALSAAHNGAAGGIVSYSGVDPINPIDVSAGAVTPSSASHDAPSITTTVDGDMLVTVHAYASAAPWTPPAGMNERVDIASRSASTAGVALEMNDLLVGVAGATGVKTATASGGTSADVGGTAAIALRALISGPHHIRIEHDGQASTCQPEAVTLKACANADCTAPHYSASDVIGINLLPTTAADTWSPGSTVAILASNGGVSSGVTLARGSSGTAVLAITGTPAPAPSLGYECFNTATGTSGDCNLVYTAGGFAFDVAHHAAGNRQVVTLTSCASGFANTNRSVTFWSSYVNPAAGSAAGRIVAGVAGNADCSTGYAALGTSAAGATALSLSFGAGATPQASFSLCYPDVGELRLDARYDGGLANTPPDSGVVILGNDNFVAKPDHFTVSAVRCTTADAAHCGAGALAMGTPGDNPAAVDASGGAFMRAGNASLAAARFTATVTAKNAQDVATPNFGLESTPEGVQLSAVLVAPAGGSAGQLSCMGAVSGCVVPGGAANFSSGAATLTDLAWNEVGILQLAAQVADADYLGAGAVSGSTSGNVGRFYPAQFAVTTTSVTPACVPGGAATPFSYFGEDGVRTDFTLSAQNLGGSTTANYTGVYAKLDATVYANHGFTAATLPAGASLASGATAPSGTWSNGVANITAWHQISRPTAPTGPTTVTLSAAPTDGDVPAAATPAVLGDADLRYGRLQLLNAYGSELLDLPVTLRAQYWNGSIWATNSDDSCTSISAPTSGAGLTFYPEVAPAAVGNHLSAGETTATVNAGGKLNAGLAGLKFSRPGAGNSGYVDISIPLAARPWLQHPWGTSAVNPTGLNPSGRATFGIYKSRLIYSRENH